MSPKQIIQRYLTPRQVEQIYSIPVGTLANLRSLGRGAKYFTLNGARGKKRKVLYFIDDIELWIRANPSHTVDSLAENGKMGGGI